MSPGPGLLIGAPALLLGLKLKSVCADNYSEEKMREGIMTEPGQPAEQAPEQAAEQASERGKTWLYVGGAVAVLLLLVGVIIAVGFLAIRAQGSSKSDATVVRVSGTPGVRYAGVITNQSDGRKDITGTLGEAPDEYTTGSNGQTVASINKSQGDNGALNKGGKGAPNQGDNGALNLQILRNGDVVDSTSDAQGDAPVTVYFAGGDH
jgi:hypothetical protein